MPNHPWGASTPEMNAGVLETGSTSLTWATASAAWMGLASATLATMGITGGQMAESLTSISGVRSSMHEAATPPFLTWLGTMAGIAFKQAAICAVVAESYGMARSTMIPSMQSINNRVREAAAEASNIFGQNTPLIGALNAEYGGYTVENASIGSTYGEVITAATLPMPIPPPPPLGNAAKAAADSSQALQQGSQLVSQAGGGAASKAASQAGSAVGQGGGSASGMGDMGSLMQAPMQAAQGAGKMLSSPMESMQKLLSAPMDMFGKASGLGDLLGGGSTGSSFSPSLGGAGGLPLGGSSGLGGGSGAGLGGGGGLGGVGSPLTSKSEGSNSSNSRSAVLSGVSGSPTQERLAGATMGGGGGGMPMAPGHAGSGAGSRARRAEAVVTTYGGDPDGASRRTAQGNERDLFN